MRKRLEAWLNETSGLLDSYVPGFVGDLVAPLIVIIVIVVAHRIIKRIVFRAMQHDRREDSEIRQVQSMLKYTFMLIGLIFVVVSFSGSLAAMGMSAAFISMVLGWSLQRPVTGVAAWIMVMIKRPFEIGDRIIIQGVRGDVLDISPTHILLGEVGGTIGGEESSNRGILIPNAVLFDQMVINYAVSEEAKHILDEVPVRISYDSDYGLAQQTLIDSAAEVTREIIEETGQMPFTRSEFFDSGVMMRLRYKSIAVERQRISSEIVGRIVEAFSQSDQLGFAYPRASIEYRSGGDRSLPPMFRSVELPDKAKVAKSE